MEELDKLERRIHTTRDLQSVVGVMKSVAASRVHEYDEAVSSIEAYGLTIATGLQIAMRNRPHELARPRESGKRLGAVIIGSDQGLCGDFNERIVEYAFGSMDTLGSAPDARSVVAVGRRAAAYMETSGRPPEERFVFGELRDTYGETILPVLQKIEEWDLRAGIDRIALFYNSPTAGATFESRLEYLLPPDIEWLTRLAESRWTGPSLPTFSIGWEEMFSRLVNHHIFFILYRAFVASMASENTSRLRAMEAADKNIDERLDDLRTRYNKVRQAAITAELLDISTGYEAVSGFRAGAQGTVVR